MKLGISIKNIGLIFLAAVLFSGCIKLNEPEYITFKFKTTGDEVFYASTTDEKVIDRARRQLQLPVDQRNLFINGKIKRGTAGNNDWSWHFVPDEWQLVQVSIEVCSGRPSYVEQDLDYWVDNIGRFCPFSSNVIQEVN